MNYFDRGTNQWYDELIKENFIKISKKKFVKPSDYYYINNVEKENIFGSNDFISISIGIRTPTNITFIS